MLRGRFLRRLRSTLYSTHTASLLFPIRPLPNSKRNTRQNDKNDTFFVIYRIRNYRDYDNYVLFLSIYHIRKINNSMFLYRLILKKFIIIVINELEVKLEEIWKPIKGYEGCYEISSLGRVKSVERKVYNSMVLGDGCYRTVPERIRKPNIMRGYHCTALRKDNRVKVFRIHRLVMEHFGEKQPSEEYQVNHIDGDKSNNRIDNLEWVTPLENTTHAFENGLRLRHLTEETLDKMSKATKARWKDKNYRDFQTQMMKDTWKRRKERGWKTWKTRN